MFFAALMFIAATYFLILFYRGFSDPDEGRYAEIPREMVVSGKWLEMRMLGFRYYEKPPLSYWLVAPVIKIFGAQDWAVRIPLLFSGFLGLFLLWRLAAKRFGRSQGAFSILVMASTVGFVAGNGLLLTDSFLLAFFSATCVFLYLAFEGNSSGQWKFLLMAAVAAGLGFLTKGAVAVVLPGAILFLWLLWKKNLRALFRPSIIAAAVFFLCLILPLLWLIEEHNPGFVRHFIFEEHIARFQGTRSSQLHPEPCWFFFEVIPLLLLPWTLFLFRAARLIWKQQALAHDSLARFLAVWAAVVIGFFSVSTGKLMSYILPALPPLGLMIGRWGVVPPAERGDKWDMRFWRLGVAGFYGIAVALLFFWGAAYFRVWPEKIYPITGGSVLALLPLLAVWLYCLRSPTALDFGKLLLFNAGIILTCALLLSPLAGKDFNVLVHINSSYVYKSLARRLNPEDKIIVFWSYRPALPFYTQRLYTPFQEHNELFQGMQLEPERPADLDSVEELNRLWDNFNGRIFAVVEPQDLAKKFRPLNLAYRETDLPRDPDTIVYELFRPSE